MSNKSDYKIIDSHNDTNSFNHNHKQIRLPYLGNYYFKSKNGNSYYNEKLENLTKRLFKDCELNLNSLNNNNFT